MEGDYKFKTVSENWQNLVIYLMWGIGEFIGVRKSKIKVQTSGLGKQVNGSYLICKVWNELRMECYEHHITYAV